MADDREVDEPQRREDKEERLRDKERDRERRRSSSKERRDSSRRRRSRSRSRERRHRSRSRERRRDRRSRSRSRSRDSRDRRRRSRSRDDSRSRRDRDLPKAVPVPTATDPYAALRAPVAPAIDPLELQRLWQEQQLRARQMVLQQQAVSAKTAATKTQREVYVGNLVAGAISDAMLTQIFNTALMVRFPGTNIPGMEPVIKSSIHKDGRYAFVEFRTAEMATAALDLSGQVQFLGQAMTVNRPSGYVDPAKMSAAAVAATTTLQAFQAGAMPQPPLFSAAPTAFPGLAGLAPAAYPSLPGPPPMPYGAVAAAPAAVPVATADGVSVVPTAAIRVTGMIGADVLGNDLEYSEVLEELKSECDKYAPGAVLQVKVPRPPQPDLSAQLVGTGNYGRAFVLFADAASAQKASGAIHGRMYSGKSIQVEFITQDAFLGV